MESALVLREALTHIAKLRGRALVLKIGGEAILSPQFGKVVADIALLHAAGLPVTLVFGAQFQIDEALRNANIPIRKEAGLRVTTEESMPVIQKVCQSVADMIKEVFLKVGAKCNLLPPNFIIAAPLGEEHGLTGRAERMTDDGIRQTEDLKAVTIVSPLAICPSPSAIHPGTLLNVNADEIAYIVAKCTETEKLIFLTGVDGIRNREGQDIFQINPDQAATLIKNGTVTGGMIPKLEFAVKAFADGVKSCHIVNYKNGRLLEEVLTSARSGTMIVP